METAAAMSSSTMPSSKITLKAETQVWKKVIFKKSVNYHDENGIIIQLLRKRIIKKNWSGGVSY